MKKKLRSVLASALAFTLALSGCGSTASESAAGSTSDSAQATAEATADAAGFSEIKLAFATNSVSEAFVQMQTAFDETIGPALNIEFMYSEEIKDSSALTTFIENAYAAGCQGVICNYSNANDQAAALCNDLGMYFVGIASADATENTEMPYYVSVAGASAEGYGESYAEAVKSVVDDGEEHSLIVLSGAACYGATSAIEGTAGALRALEDVYSLTYEQDPSELALVSVQTDAANDKGIKITIVPGMSDLTTAVSPLLQTGDYDVVVGTNDVYANLNVAISEVEAALGMDIKVISKNPFSDTISTAFNSTDSNGSPVVNAVICDGTYERVAAVLLLRNACDGYADQMRSGDACSRVPGMNPLVITSAEDYNALSDSSIPYSFVTEEDLLSLCCVNDPTVTYETIDAFGAALTTENILAKFSQS